MKVGELIVLLQQCDQDVTVNFVDEEGYFSDILFVENRLESPGWGATVCLYEGKPNWEELLEQDCEVEEISAKSKFATTKYREV